MSEFLEAKAPWFITIICLIIACWMIFIEYQYATEGDYAIGKIERLWWTEGSESDSYYVAYSYIDKFGNKMKSSHLIDLKWWDRLNDGDENLSMVQYIKLERSRLLGKTGWLWICIWVGVSLVAFFYKVFITRHKSTYSGPWGRDESGKIIIK